jgi:hypothetical protein
MSKRSETMNIAAKIRGMKPGDIFDVPTKADQIEAIRTGKALHRSGAIEFTITTFKNEDSAGWRVARLG